jgi:hypothetical protein
VQIGVEKGKETAELAPQTGELMEVADETVDTVEEQKENSDMAKAALEEDDDVYRRRHLLKLVAGKKTLVAAKIMVPKYQLLRSSAEMLEGPGSRITVHGTFPIDDDLVLRMSGLVWVRSGRVTVDARKLVRRGKLVRNHKMLMVNSTADLMMVGRLVVRQDVVMTEGLDQIVQVEGQLKMRSGQFLYVKRWLAETVGRLNIKAGQVLNVEGEMWAVDVRFAYVHDLMCFPARRSRPLDMKEEEDSGMLEADLKGTNKVELVAGEKHRVVGYVCVPDNKILRVSTENVLGPSSEITVRGQLKTDEHLVMTMTGTVKVKSGEVTLDSHKIVRHGRLLKNVKDQVVHRNQVLHMTGKLTVMQNIPLTVGSHVVVQVEGQFKTMAHQTLYVKGYHSQIPGQMNIKPGQVLDVDGQVRVILQRKKTLSIQVSRSINSRSKMAYTVGPRFNGGKVSVLKEKFKTFFFTRE